MRCPVEGNPPPEIEWRVAMTASPTQISNPTFGALIGRGEYFERDKIHENDFGGYVCIARSQGFPPISKKIILAKKCKCTF